MLCSLRSKPSVKDEYTARIKKILEEHNPAKAGGVSRLISKNRYNEHGIYVNVCKKYGVDPMPEYKGPSADDDEEDESDDPFASDADEDDDAPAAAEEEAEPDEDEEEKKEDETPDFMEPVAWQLVFRQTSPRKGGGWVKPTDFQVDDENPDAPIYSNFKILDEKYQNSDGAYKFRLRFPGRDDNDKSTVIWTQSNSPLEDEVLDFEAIYLGDYEGFAGLCKEDDVESISQASGGFELGVAEEHSDGIADRGLKGPVDSSGEVSMAHIVELLVEAPAIVRLPLIDDAVDLEGNETSLQGGATFSEGSLKLPGDVRGYVSVANSKEYASMKKSFSVACWFQQPYTQGFAQVISKGPWRKAFSIGCRHTEGEGNTIRFSCSGAQGMVSINKNVKSWDKFPKLEDKTLQSLTNEEADLTWFHCAMTFGGSKFRAYVNGEFVGEKTLHGNVILRNKDLAIGCENSDSQGHNFLKGRVYDVCVFPRDISQLAIKSLMEGGRPRQEYIRQKEASLAEAAAKEAASKGPSDKFLEMQRRMAARKGRR